MKKRMKWVAAAAAVLAVFWLGGCQMEQEHVFSEAEAISLRQRNFTVVSENETTYFSAGEDLYEWNRTEGTVTLAGNEVFYKNEPRQLTSFNGKLYSVNWYTGSLFSFDPDTKTVEDLADIPDYETAIWNWDGYLCCLAADVSGVMQIQIRAEEERLSVPCRWNRRSFV